MLFVCVCSSSWNRKEIRVKLHNESVKKFLMHILFNSCLIIVHVLNWGFLFLLLNKVLKFFNWALGMLFNWHRNEAGNYSKDDVNAKTIFQSIKLLPEEDRNSK